MEMGNREGMHDVIGDYMSPLVTTLHKIVDYY